MPYQRGDEHHRAKLTTKQVQAARRAYWVNKRSIKSLAESNGVSWATMNNIVNYDTWRHVDDTFEPHEVARCV